MASLAPNGSTFNPQRAAGSIATPRILCPVATCPEASAASTRHYKDFKSIKNHLSDHCTGHLSGAVPPDFLRFHDYHQCKICDKVLHTRFEHCLRCRPVARARAELDLLRERNHSAISQPSQSSQGISDRPNLSTIHSRHVPTIRNIPYKLRGLWAQCLKQALAQAVWSNNEVAWTELQMLPKSTLCRPVRGGNRHKSQRLSWTRNRLQRWLSGERGELWKDLPTYNRPQPKNVSHDVVKMQQQNRCISLTSEGGLSNACKALVSQPPVSHTEETTNILAAKHPPATSPVNMSAFGSASSSLVPLTDVALTEQGINSFHRLSGGGPSGLRPIHLKNCMSTEYRDEVLERCTALITVLSKGDAPKSLAPYLAGANLTALPKKDNGVRPVAVGEVWRRLTAKCLCQAYKEQSGSFFFPQQIGVGQALGTEIGLETARQWKARNINNPTMIFAKTDFENAFNCVNRQAFLEQCRHHFPGLSQWAEWCYSEPSQLYFGPSVISSERGVQQGDPLGPLFFALALQPLLVHLHNRRSENGLQLSYSYLDNLILAGEQHAVAEAFECVRNSAVDIGLSFNTSKCEIIPAAGHESSFNKDLFPEDVIIRSDGNFELLGGPIGCDDYCDNHTQDRVNKAKELLSALGELPNAQVALTLLRHCASFGKLVYSLRVVPHGKHRRALRSYDEAVRDCVESFLSCSFSDSEWSMANLSTKMGGLGLRSTEQHSSAAFLASQAAVWDLCIKLDPYYANPPNSQKSELEAALIDYNSKVKDSNKLQADLGWHARQQELSKNIDECTLETIRDKHRNNRHFQAHCNHVTASGAGSWLHATPSEALGTQVDSQLYRTMVQHWLRVPIHDTEYYCPYCDEVVDRYGDHCLTCACGGDRTKRHNLLRNEVYHFCHSAGLHPELEKPDLLQARPLIGAFTENGANRDQSSNRRPADVYIPRWRRGAPAALDFAVTSGLRGNILARSSVDGSAAPTEYENFKRTHLETESKCREEGLTFIPMICEADGGGWGPAAHKVWSVLAKEKALIAGEKDSTIVSRLLQSLGLILHRENVRSILRRSPRNLIYGCKELLAASAACTSMEVT